MKTIPVPYIYRTLWVLDSKTRGGMAILELWDLNSSKKWRAENPDKLVEQAEALIEVEANAKLIAAAPDLLLAVQNCLAVIEARASNCEINNWQARLAQARAAILKATT